MSKVTFKELLDRDTELGRARRKKLAPNFAEMVRRAQTADLEWLEADSRRQELIQEQRQGQVPYPQAPEPQQLHSSREPSVQD